MMSPTEQFIYWVVMPVSLIFAYKRIPFQDLRLSTTVWSIPWIAAQYVLLHENAAGARLVALLLLLLAVYVGLVLAGDRFETWLESRKRG